MRIDRKLGYGCLSEKELPVCRLTRRYLRLDRDDVRQGHVAQIDDGLPIGGIDIAVDRRLVRGQQVVLLAAGCSNLDPYLLKLIGECVRGIGSDGREIEFGSLILRAAQSIDIEAEAVIMLRPGQKRRRGDRGQWSQRQKKNKER